MIDLKKNVWRRSKLIAIVSRKSKPIWLRPRTGRRQLPPSPKTNHRHKWQRPRKPLSVRHRVQAGPSPWVRINLQYRLRC